MSKSKRELRRKLIVVGKAGSVASSGSISPAARRSKFVSTQTWFSTSEICTLLSISRSEFFQRRPHSNRTEKRCYGEVPVFAVGDLPVDLKNEIEDLRVERQCADYKELLRLIQQQRRLPHVMRMALIRIAPARSESAAVQVGMFRFFRSVDNGDPSRLGYRRARVAISRLLGWKPTDRTLRRIIAKVDNFGGPEMAPLDAYSDILKSTSHARLDGASIVR